MQLGTADAAPGELATGYLEVTDLPTGTAERLPVVLAAGEREGPTLWLTAAIHGNEHTGMAAAQDAMVESLPGRLRGSVVCLPVVNPAGLRRNARTSYYHDDDPNRQFPDAGAERTRPPRVQELIARRLYDAFAGSADALVDLHTAHVGSMPFVIRDRVLYGEREDEASDGDDASGEDGGTSDEDGGAADEDGTSDEDDAPAEGHGAPATEAAARELADDLAALVEATGLPVVNEYPPAEYTDRNLQRSTAGAALNEAGIPAFTLELGSHDVVEEDNRALGVRAVYEVMAELGMVEAVPPAVDAADEGLDAPVAFPVRRYRGPYTGTAGIVRHRVEAGDVVEAGDDVAEIVTPHGTPEATVAVEYDGYVLGRRSGTAVYENDPLATLAIRDEGDLVAPREDG